MRSGSPSKSESESLFRFYLQLLSYCYFAGFALHLIDLSNVRSNYTELGSSWRYWVIYLVASDFAAGIGLFLGQIWGQIIFLVVAASQLVAYLGFKSYLGEQNFLIGFHIITISIYFLLKRLPKDT